MVCEQSLGDIKMAGVKSTDKKTKTSKLNPIQRQLRLLVMTRDRFKYRLEKCGPDDDYRTKRNKAPLSRYGDC